MILNRRSILPMISFAKIIFQVIKMYENYWPHWFAALDTKSFGYPIF
ncbi:MAG: hypothetical protein ACJAYB_003243 [Psychromonas sp.]|jgi:hypothetical protein